MYKIILIGGKNDYDRFLIEKSVEKEKNIIYSESPEFRFRGLKWFIYKLHNSEKIKQYINLPFKKIWAKFFLSKKIKKLFSSNDKVMFIFGGSDYKYISMDLFTYLRNQYPGCKLVYCFPDTVKLYSNKCSNLWNVLEENFDLVITYNQIDAEKYNLPCTPPKIYSYDFVELNVNIPKSDVFFVGREKGRLEELLNIFEICEKAGFKCDFHIIDVPEEKQKYADKITYNKKISYMEVLQRSKNAKAILNIIQDGASGITLRDYEAIGMNKCLITNGDAIKKFDFYSEDKVIMIENLENELYKINDQTSTWNETDKYSVEHYYRWLEQQVDNLDSKRG